MTLERALEIVKDHIRIGKGMELVNGVPEALEMVVEELAVTQKALELICKTKPLYDYYIRQAKEV